MLDEGLKNRAYVDDLTAWTKGENRVEVTQGLVWADGQVR